jgi:hypothetical protein
VRLVSAAKPALFRRRLNRIVLADDPVAADATCARLMGLDPDKIIHIRAGAQFLGNSEIERIEQFAEPVCLSRRPFQTVPEFEFIRVNTSPAPAFEPIIRRM